MMLKSGLRGRGGARLPHRHEVEICRRFCESDQKYVCCNADEGDPGAFMDRSVLEGDPHVVVEAMAIAGYAIGADQGYVYCPRGVPHCGQASADRHLIRRANMACWARTSLAPALISTWRSVWAQARSSAARKRL